MSKGRGTRAVATWIGIGVFMLVVQVILGGVTRLTGSGLSITEWNVVTGVLPPLHDQQWTSEFEKYRHTPQFKLLNSEFTIRDFKFIFFWEWIHRFWARLIGVVFVIGFVYLLVKEYLKKEMVKPLLILFLLGALQGAVGWIMVASGLTGDAVYVAPTRLALHFIFAMVLIGYAWWFFLDLSVGRQARVKSSSLRTTVFWILGLLIVQLTFGALMAGHKAALAAPTWPDINGRIMPRGLLHDKPIALNLVDNKITIHFVHRTLAYIIFLLIVFFTVRANRLVNTTRTFRQWRPVPLMLALLQIFLGVAALISSPRIVPHHWGPFEWFAQLHQIVGMMLALTFVTFAYLVSRRSTKLTVVA